MRKLLVLLALVLPLAFAQKIDISPESIVVNPNPAPDFNVRVTLDKAQSGNARPVYQLGENVQITVRVSQSAYVYLFSVEPNGKITQILPNRYDQQGRNNYLHAGESRTFPPSNARYHFSVSPPTGLSKVIAVASKRQLDTSQLAHFNNGQDFASSDIGQQGFVQGFAIIVKPLPQQDWVTDTALYYVGSGSPSPVVGTLSVDSRPRQAAVYVDGNFVGTTPTRYSARPGRHDVRVTKDGYEPFQTSVNLRAGETQSVLADLQPVYRTGQVSFDSFPRGANVYLDGNYVGSTPVGRMNVDAGSHQARFTLPGYQDASVQFSLNAGDYRQVNVTLNRATGTLQIRDNVGGAIAFVDGHQVGTIASGSGLLTVDGLQPGQHELTLVAPNYHSYVSAFTIQPGQTTRMQTSQTPF